MTGLLIGLAVLAAVGLVAARALRSRQGRGGREAALLSTPGMSAGQPLRIRSFHELDDAVESWRCPCGGPLDRIGEGSRPGLRVVRCACTICEEDVDLFFELSELRH